MVTGETIWAVLSVHQRRSIMALAAIMVLHSERYRHLVSVPRNQGLKPALWYREYCHTTPSGPSGTRMGERSLLHSRIILILWDSSGICIMSRFGYSKTGHLLKLLFPETWYTVVAKIILMACYLLIHLTLSINC